MGYDLILFSLFSSLAIVSGIMIISLSNAVHSVLFLIFLFCNIISLLLLIEVEFLSLLFLIVYVGAIAVLFLFVIMMLNIKTKTIKSNFSLYIWPLGLIISFILFLQFLITIDINFITLKATYNLSEWTSWIKEINTFSNVKIIGLVLYTKYSFLFLLCSFLLLVSMIGVIVLTIHQRTSFKKQDVNQQLERKFKKTLIFSNIM